MEKRVFGEFDCGINAEANQKLMNVIVDIQIHGWCVDIAALTSIKFIHLIACLPIQMKMERAKERTHRKST